MVKEIFSIAVVIGIAIFIERIVFAVAVGVPEIGIFWAVVGSLLHTNFHRLPGVGNIMGRYGGSICSCLAILLPIFGNEFL